MIKEISLKNFKAFKEAQISLGNINLFTGLNGMGKSSFIQALLILRQSYQLRSQLVDELMLQGNLINIGLGSDAFSRYSSDDFMDINIQWDNDAMLKSSVEFKPLEKNQENIQELNILPAEYEVNGNWNEQSLFNNRFEYLNAMRINPEVKFDFSTYDVIKLDTLGIHGEYTFHYISEYQRTPIPIKELAHPDTQFDGDISLLGQIDKWMSYISPGVKLTASADKDTEISQAFFAYEMALGKTDNFKPRNVGFGITYALPVVTAVLKAKTDDLVIIENPESHIHPQGQAWMGELFAIAAENGVQLIIETHSDHILNGIRYATKQQKVNADKVKLFFFERDSNIDEHFTTITEPQINQQGKIDEWPDGFFDTWGDLSFKLI